MLECKGTGSDPAREISIRSNHKFCDSDLLISLTADKFCKRLLILVAPNNIELRHLDYVDRFVIKSTFLRYCKLYYNDAFGIKIATS